MKNIFFTLLFLSISFGALGQEIEKITFSSKGFDEPPTKPGKPELKVEYVKDESGNYVAKHYFQNKKKIKLKTPISIEKERISLFQEWKTQNSNEFYPSDLGIDHNLIGKKAEEKNFKLNFPIPDKVLIQIDSFNLCQNWKMTKSFSTGGHKLRVTLKYQTGESNNFEFGEDDLGIGRFDMKGFIYSYHILTDRIPEQVHQYDFFTKESFAEIMLDYLKTIECEGFYYNEFKINNPERTPAENRMRQGWDFLEYMKMRGKE